MIVYITQGVGPPTNVLGTSPMYVNTANIPVILLLLALNSPNITKYFVTTYDALLEEILWPLLRSRNKPKYFFPLYIPARMFILSVCQCFYSESVLRLYPESKPSA